MTDTTVSRSALQVIPAELAKGEHDCRYIRMATIRAVGVEYTVWQNWEEPGNTAYVLRVPTDGPAEYVQHWGDKSQRAVIFSAKDQPYKNSWRVLDAAVQYAAKSASDDILAEYI